jgi:dTDP-4-dehydrorhamnose 3,5-epimerase
MIFRETALPGAFVVDIEPVADERGFFARTWCQREFEEQGLTAHVVQTSLSLTRTAGTLRGLHYQARPHAEVKLVRCSRGVVYDVIVDLRPDSTTYRHWIGLELDASVYRMLYIPEEFAHGFLTLTDDCEVVYYMSRFHTPGAARGVRWDDPAVGVRWPADVRLVSDRDTQWPLLPPAR